MRPTVGRVVHYSVAGAEGGLVQQAAIITGATKINGGSWEDDETHWTVTLHIFDGKPNTDLNAIPFSADYLLNHWTWPVK